MKYRNSTKDLYEFCSLVQQETEAVLRNANIKLSKDDREYLESRLLRYRSIIRQLNRIDEFRFWMSHCTGEPMTLEEIGEIMGITRERVRQLETKAIKKIRHPAIGIQLKEYCKITREPEKSSLPTYPYFWE